MIEAFTNVVNLEVLIPWVGSLFFGIFVGGIPGLTATMAVALIVPISYYMSPTAGLAMIIGVSFTSIFAGDIPAIFLRIPGTPASAAALIDGYEMNKKGKGDFALALALLCSAMGGMLGILILIFVSHPLARFALRFSHFEYFWLGIFGLSMSAVISDGSELKGLFSVLLGLLIASFGMDITTGYPRFTFGTIELLGGIDFIPVMIGLFGLSEALKYVTQPTSLQTTSKLQTTIKIPLRKILDSLWLYKKTIFSASIIGTIVGALPGAGADMGAWVAYGLTKNRSNNKEKFGQGSREGIIAPSSANNSSLGGTWIPALVFGIPGDSITAIVLGAMMMYGLTPGPLIFERNPELINSIFMIAFLTQFMLILVGFLGIKFYSVILLLKRNIVMSIVIIFSLIGAFALNNSIFDMGIVLVLGLIGFVMEKLNVPLPPLILAVILGPMIESNLRIGLLKSRGSLLPFINRPISLLILTLILLTFFGDKIFKLVKSRIS